MWQEKTENKPEAYKHVGVGLTIRQEAGCGPFRLTGRIRPTANQCWATSGGFGLADIAKIFGVDDIFRFWLMPQI